MYLIVLEIFSNISIISIIYSQSNSHMFFFNS